MQRRQITKFSTNFDELFVWGKVRELNELYNGYVERNNYNLYRTPGTGSPPLPPRTDQI